MFTIFAALAQMERRLLSERTRAGLEAARKRGRVGGRPTVMTPEPPHVPFVARVVVGPEVTKHGGTADPEQLGDLLGRHVVM